jgi:hypothetical protein
MLQDATGYDYGEDDMYFSDDSAVLQPSLETPAFGVPARVEHASDAQASATLAMDEDSQPIRSLLSRAAPLPRFGTSFLSVVDS